MGEQYLSGLLKVLAACVLWGLGYPIWKTLSLAVPPLPLIALTFSLASATIFFVYRLRVRSLLLAFKQHWIALTLIGIFGGVLGTGLILFALSRIDTGIAALLEKLQPVFVVLAARIFLHEAIPRHKIKWMIFALGFSYLIAVPRLDMGSLAEQDSLGLLAAFGASFFYGMNTILSKYLVDTGIQAKELVCFRMGIGSAVAYVFWFLWPGESHVLQTLTGETLGLLVLATAVSLTSAYILFLSGLREIPAATAAFVELLTPLVALGMAYLVFGERLSETQLLAIPFFVFFVYQISKSSKPLHRQHPQKTPSMLH